MWVLKTHGETFYVNHVDCGIPWSTKETPDNNHTKGSIKVKEVLLQIDADNCATLTKLSIFDKVRLRNQKLGITRIMFRPGEKMHNALKNKEFRHSPFKFISGACSSSFVVCDLLDRADATFATLKYQGEFRVLQPNEFYYQEYDGDAKTIKVNYSDESTPYEYS